MPKAKGKNLKNKGHFKSHNPGKKKKKGSGNIRREDYVKLNVKSTAVPAITSHNAPGSGYWNLPALASARVPSRFSQSAVQGEDNTHGDPLAGYIFLCNGQTKPECFRFGVFGLPAASIAVVKKITPNMKLFLFDFSLKLLYGVYAAASNGELGLEPAAFGGKFPAQVRFEILRDCLPLPESAFKHGIKDNYEGGSKFRQEISYKQVNSLMSLFRPVAVPPVAPLLGDRGYIAGIEYARGRSAVVDVQHVQQPARHLPYEPPRLVGRLACTQFPLVGSQPSNGSPYYAAEADRTFLGQGSYTRYTSHLENSESIPQQGYATEHVKHNLGVSAVGASPAQAHAVQLSQLQMQAYNLHQSQLQGGPSHGAGTLLHADVPSSTMTASYWTAMASRDANVYASPCQGEQEENVEKETGNHGELVAVSAACAPIQQAHHALPQPLRSYVPPYVPANLPSSSQTATYWPEAAAARDPYFAHSSYY